MTCPACGTPQTPTARYCSSCGFRLDGTISQRPYSSSAATATSGGTQQPLAPNSVLQGRYRLERALGTGAFGRVYLAVDTQDAGDPAVAIKELLDSQFATPDEQREVITWFKREAGILLSLDHPSIPAIHGYWTAHRASGPFYLAMDYIPGKTLDSVLHDAGGRVSWPQVVQWGIALCDVLGYLHRQAPPFIFRDMKLENVILDSRTGLPVLIDFGITRQLATTTGTAIGTWGYVPFEQVLGNAEPRSDLYALGATLHALLTGRHPDAEYTRLQRSGLNVENAMRALFPPADTLVPDIPPALAETLSKVTSFAPTDRFPDAAAMAAALEAARAQGSTQRATQALPSVAQGTAAAARLGSTSPAQPVAPTTKARQGGQLVVAPDGSGDFQSLEDAVCLAPPGATLALRAGTYRLMRPLQIDNPLTLIGMGRSSTHVVCAAEGEVVRCVSNGRFAASDMSFAHDGSQWGNVVDVLNAEVDFRRCDFTGGVRDETGNRGGCGLIFAGVAKGTVSECVVCGNQLHGIYVSGQAQPTLDGNTCCGNQQSGIAYFERAAGFARGNTCAENEKCGIYVGEQAAPTLEGNSSCANQQAGMAYFGGSAGLARNNVSIENDHGIYIGEQAQPAIEANTCRANRQAGLAYFGRTAGHAHGNICTENTRYGIYVGEQAHPSLEGNTCHANQESGLGYGDSAFGLARNNICSENATCGITVNVQAQPTLERNTCRANQDSGLVYFDSAAGLARENSCTENVRFGIYVGGQAQPTLEVNTCKGNCKDGISIRGTSHPHLAQNVCDDNGEDGIYVEFTARATGVGNQCQSNKGRQVNGRLHTPSLSVMSPSSPAAGTTIQRRATLQLGLVIDTSDSMKGWARGRFSQKKIDLVREAARLIIGHLNERDYITIVVASAHPQVLVPPQWVRNTQPRVLRAIDSLSADGGILMSNDIGMAPLGSAIATVLQELHSMPDPENGSSAVIILSGSNPADGSYCRRLAEQTDIRFMLGGFGDDYNAALFNEMARSSHGISERIDSTEMAQQFVSDVMAAIRKG